jgi:excisionase family DNA binding protein
MAKRRARKSGEIYDPNVLLRRTHLLRKSQLLPDEAAFLLEVTRKTVDNYMATGKLEYTKSLGGHRRVLTDSVRPYVRF